MTMRVLGAATATAVFTTLTAVSAHAEPAPELPSSEKVSQVLGELTDPDVPDQVKDHLVQGGIDSTERRAFNHGRLKKAVEHGQLPLAFDVGNIWSVGPQTAAAQVTVWSPTLSPTTKVFTFIDQSGWILSSDSASALISTVAHE